MRRGLLLFLVSSLLLVPLLSIQATIATTPPMIQYTKTWGGSNSDLGQGVAVDSSGNKYVTGLTYSFGPGNPSKAAVLLLKYSSSGVLLWQRIWSGSGNGSDVGRGVAVDASGNIYVTGSTTSFGAGNEDVLLLKFNSTGSLLWQKTWGGSNSDIGVHVALDASANIYVSGFTGSFGSGKGVLLKFDSSGSLLWQRTWGGSIYDYGLGVAVDASGNIYVTGFTISSGVGLDVVLLKFDSTGSLLWQKTWGGSNSDEGYGVAVDASGNIYVAGSTASFGAGNTDVLLLKFDSTSGLLWQKTWGGSSADVGEGVAVDSSGNVYVTGYTNSFGSGGADVVLLKLSSAGSLLNQEIYGGSGDDLGAGVTVDSAGNAFTTGYVSEAPPYNSTTTGNSTLGAPTFLLGNPSFTLGTPAFIARTPTGSAATPSGSQTYAGTQDSFLTLYGSTLKAPLSASLITLTGLLLIPIILSRRRNLRE